MAWECQSQSDKAVSEVGDRPHSMVLLWPDSLSVPLQRICSSKTFDLLVSAHIPVILFRGGLSQSQIIYATLGVRLPNVFVSVSVRKY